MRFGSVFVPMVFLVVLPVGTEAQHSHGAGGGGMQHMPRTERQAEPPAKSPPGLLPMGSPRPIEVLVLDYGFSPSEIRATVGETVTLLVRRADPVCAKGLSIPKRQVYVELPLGETVPVTLELKQAERIEIQCRDEEAAAIVVVGSQ